LENEEFKILMSESFASIFTSDSIFEFEINTFDFKTSKNVFWDSPSSKLRLKFRYDYDKLQKFGVNDLTCN